MGLKAQWIKPYTITTIDSNFSEEYKNILGEEICEYCPWRNGEIDRICDSTCEGTWCDDALDNFMDENQDYFDNEE